jgi:hypothetical protein
MHVDSRQSIDPPSRYCPSIYHLELNAGLPAGAGGRNPLQVRSIILRGFDR